MGAQLKHGRIESRLRLDVRTFRQKGWLKNGAGVVAWQRDGQSTASLTYQVGDGHLLLDYTTHDDDNNALPVQVRVPLVKVPCTLGGHRHYWHCPHCGRRCEVLLSGWGGRGWGCRVCLQLRYESQQLSPVYRILKRGRKVMRQVGATDPNDPRSAIKPKGMRWATFDRKVRQATAMLDSATPLLVSRVAYQLQLMHKHRQN